MNNKDLFKKALENEMPDLESVREKCLNQNVKSETKVFMFKNATVRRIVPAVACLMLIIIAFATIKFTDDPNNLIYNELNHNETTKSVVTEEKQTKKNTQSNYYNNYYTQAATSAETTVATTEDEVKKTLASKNNLNKVPTVSSVSFESFTEFCSIASTFDVVGSNVVFKNGKLYMLSIPEQNLSMILQNKKVYGFSIDGNIISNSGNISNDFCRGLTGCKFYTSYGDNSYTIGYSTYGNAFGGEIIETVSSAQGYDFHYLGSGTYVAYIDGFCFAIQNNTDNHENAKEFIKNLSIFSKDI